MKLEVEAEELVVLVLRQGVRQFQKMAVVLFRYYRYFQLFGHFVTCDVDFLFKTQNERLSERK